MNEVKQDPAVTLSNRELAGFMPTECFLFGMEYGMVTRDCLRKQMAPSYRIRAANSERIQRVLAFYGYESRAAYSTDLAWVVINVTIPVVHK